MTNEEVFPILINCTIPGGVKACPTSNPHRTWLKVLLAAKNHGVDEVSVPKKGKLQLKYQMDPTHFY